MAKIFTRGQTQILYRYLPEAIFEHEDYGLCKVQEVTVGNADRINRPALFDTLVDALSYWEREEFRSGFPDPRSEKGQRQYKIGQPLEVRFNPFPLVLQCRECKHVVEFQRINKKKTAPGACPREGCGGRMLQLPYVEAHNCGRLGEIYLPTNGCPEHGRQYLRFYNPGRTQAARWVCGICGREVQKPRMTPCKCAYSDYVSTVGRSQYEKYLRLYPTSEPGLYIPHVVAFINFKEEEEKKLSRLDDALPLLLARLWGILDRRVLDLAEERKKWKPGVGSIPPEMKSLIDALKAINPDHPSLKAYEKYLSSPPGHEILEQVRDLNRGVLPIGPVPRKLVEHVALQDNMRLTGIDTIVNRLRERGSKEYAAKFEKESYSILERLGIQLAKIVNDFPIALTALGFTRVSRDPRLSVFNPFPPGEDGLIPLFVIPTETEGLWFQLDPAKVAIWLHRNNFVAESLPGDHPNAWAWLYRSVFSSYQSGEDGFSPARVALMTLIHTISHVFLQKIEWSGFASSSVGEYLMPESLSFVLYANRYAESKIGGLTTLFEQRLPLWLYDSAQSGRECIYDPLCEEDGGSCVGCLHREHNCSEFNQGLSRAVLYGGCLPAENQTGIKNIVHGYWEQF